MTSHVLPCELCPGDRAGCICTNTGSEPSAGSYRIKDMSSEANVSSLECHCSFFVDLGRKYSCADNTDTYDHHMCHTCMCCASKLHSVESGARSGCAACEM
eukprot:scaffold33753_cov42-Tisochrysis_lutea.AAC.1